MATPTTPPEVGRSEEEQTHQAKRDNGAIRGCGTAAPRRGQPRRVLVVIVAVVGAFDVPDDDGRHLAGCDVEFDRGDGRVSVEK
jgi:hypothetical protein